MAGVAEDQMPEPVPAALLAAEWLEADGLGGFASGTVSGIRTRRYHTLLLAATTPPTGRMALVNGLEVCPETAAGIKFVYPTVTIHSTGGGPPSDETLQAAVKLAFQAPAPDGALAPVHLVRRRPGAGYKQQLNQ
jgi:Glycogen debranching enzyme N terminal